MYPSGISSSTTWPLALVIHDCLRVVTSTIFIPPSSVWSRAASSDCQLSNKPLSPAASTVPALCRAFIRANGGPPRQAI